jgi:hypothetical protein
MGRPEGNVQADGRATAGLVPIIEMYEGEPDA